jgi:hypothetical protein
MVSYERTLWYLVIAWNRGSPNLATTMVLTKLLKEEEQATLWLARAIYTESGDAGRNI